MISINKFSNYFVEIKMKEILKERENTEVNITCNQAAHESTGLPTPHTARGNPGRTGCKSSAHSGQSQRSEGGSLGRPSHGQWSEGDTGNLG